MTKASKRESGGGRANRTRGEILAAAEHLFATNGFAATRLVDVADAVDLTRAALFYHFKDKQVLYDAMISNAFGALDQELHNILDTADKSIPERIELAAEAWLDIIIARPTLARLILRFVADDDTDDAAQKIYSDNQLVPLKFFSLFEEGVRSGELTPLHKDPLHIASAVIGTTVFYVSALARLIPEGTNKELTPEQLKTHKQEALLAARLLMGISSHKADD